MYIDIYICIINYNLGETKQYMYSHKNKSVFDEKHCF